MARTTLPTASEQDLAFAHAVLRGRRAGRGKLIIDDTENIEAAVRAGVHVLKVFRTTTDGQGTPEWSWDGIPQVGLTSADADRLFGNERSSRVFAVARQPRPARLEDLAQRPGDVVVLDGARLVGNIGAVVRSAAAMGAAGVVLVGSDLREVTDRRLVRASRGLVFSVPVVLADTREILRFCAGHDLPLYAAAAGPGAPLETIERVDERIAIALGSEKHGCSPEVLTAAAGTVAIRTASTVESLNLSVAAGIALYCRRHHNLGLRRARRQAADARP